MARGRRRAAQGGGARRSLSGRRGDLAAQFRIARGRAAASRAPSSRPEPGCAGRARAPEPAVPPLRIANGLGGFSSDDGDYVVVLDGDQETPMPWANVIANPDFGTIVTDVGAAWTWSENSRENRLTPFANDPVIDPTSEAIFLRDEDERRDLVPRRRGRCAATARDGRWVVRHGPGCTTLRARASRASRRSSRSSSTETIRSSTRCSRSRTTRTRPRRMSVFAYAEWALVSAAPRRAPPRRHRASTPTCARVARAQPLEPGVPGPGRVPRLERAGRLGDGRPARVHRPQPFARAARRRSGATELSGRSGAGLDPCGALHVRIEIPPGGTRTDRLRARRGDATARTPSTLIARHATVAAAAAASLEARRRREWGEILGAIEVRTPDDSFDLIMNRWLLYQSLSSRIWARTGYWQPSGAYGFRDQLQDVARVPVHAAGPLPRAPAARGVAAVRRGRRPALVAPRQRARHADAAARTTSSGCRSRSRPTSRRPATTALLDEEVPFLEAPALEPGQVEAYGQPTVVRAARARSSSTACARSIAGLTAGAHGLPLIGSGDWNDGMNRVGRAGQGREHVARLVPARGPHAVRAVVRGARRRRARRPLPRGGRRGSRRCSTTPGTASGIAAATSTTARRSDRRRARSARSTRSRSRGRSCRAPGRPSGPSARWTRSAGSSSGGRRA